MNSFEDIGRFFKDYFLCSNAGEWESGFRCGSFLAISTFLILLFLIILLRLLFFRKHQIRQLVLDGPAGKYVISVAAIADLLTAKAGEFANAALLKARIYPVRGKKCQVFLHINYLPGENSGNVPELVARLQAETLSSLEEVFGIKNVDSVVVCVSRAKQKK